MEETKKVTTLKTELIAERAILNEMKSTRKVKVDEFVFFTGSFIAEQDLLNALKASKKDISRQEKIVKEIEKQLKSLGVSW